MYFKKLRTKNMKNLFVYAYCIFIVGGTVIISIMIDSIAYELSKLYDKTIRKIRIRGKKIFRDSAEPNFESIVIGLWIIIAPLSILLIS
jgi:hypothetical protein